MSKKQSKCDVRALKDFAKRLDRLTAGETQRRCRRLAGELAELLRTEARERTPVGAVPDGLDPAALACWSGYEGGTLRGAWTVSEVTAEGRRYTVAVLNPTKYASFVEYGHRQEVGRYVPALGKRLTAGWVNGRLMLTLAAEEWERQAPALLRESLERLLREAVGK